MGTRVPLLPEGERVSARGDSQMNTALEHPLNDEGVHTPAPDADFLNATAHVPGEVKEDNRNDFSEMTGGANRIIDAGGEPCWTVPEVAAVFNGIFTLLIVANVLVPYGGEHWNIPEEKTLVLGRAFLPIFKKHVPYGGGEESWLPEALMWIGALGAIKLVCGDAIRMEIRNFQLEKLKAIQKQRSTMAGTTTASTETETSRE